MRIKSLTALLLAAIILSAFTACGSADGKTAAEQTTVNGQSISETEAETTAPSPYAEMESKDFEGKVFTILDANYHKDLHVNIPGDTITGDAVNDMMLNRDLALEERFNISIEYVSEDGSGLNKMKKAVLAGDDAYSLVISQMISGLSDSATADVLYNMCALPYVSLGEAWWSPLMADALNIGGKQYYTATDIAPSVYQSPCCMFLNLKLYDDLSIDTDIYQLVLDGKWTFEQLESITKDLDKDLNGDGVLDLNNDFYGIGMQPTTETVGAFISGADISLCTKSEDGTNLIFDAIDNNTTLSTVDKIMKIARNIEFKDINDVINITFKSDRALFLQHKLETAAVHLRDMESDYLILPDPKNDEAQEHYISFVSGYVSGFVGIPATVEPEFTGFIAESLARYSYEYIRPLAYDIVYKEKLTRDPRSAEVLDILFDNLYIDFTAVYNFGSVNDAFNDIIFKDKPYTSTLEKKRESINKAVTKLVENW